MLTRSVTSSASTSAAGSSARSAARRAARVTDLGSRPRRRSPAARASGLSSRVGLARPSSTTKRSIAARAPSCRRAWTRPARAARPARRSTGSPTDASTAAVPVGGGVVEAARGPGELGGEHQPDAHRGPVPPPVLLAPLDGVPERVAVVEDLPQVRLAQVGRHHLGLHLDRAPHQLGQHRSGGSSAATGSASTRSRIVGSAMKPALMISALPATSSSCGRVSSVARSTSTRGRLVEGPDEVLARRGVDAGLPADRGVDHRQQRGRHVHHPHAAHPGGGDEARRGRWPRPRRARRRRPSG